MGKIKKFTQGMVHIYHLEIQQKERMEILSQVQPNNQGPIQPPQQRRREIKALRGMTTRKEQPHCGS